MKPRQQEPPRPKSLYGLDIELLRALDMENIIEESKNPVTSRGSSGPTAAASDSMNKTMTEFRLDNRLEP